MSEDLTAKVGDREVSIKVLRVDGKKLTLQFFRQVPQDDWLTSDLKPRQDIKVWGRVHYKIPGEGIEWLLVQVGEELKRCSIDPPSNYQWLLNHHQRLLDTAEAAVARLEPELVSKQQEVDAATSDKMREILASWRDRLEQSLSKARADAVLQRKELAEARQKAAASHQRITRVAELSGVAQLYIG